MTEIFPSRGPHGTGATVDLGNCEREPIHILGRVQPYGCLVAVSVDWMVLHLSENAQAMLGLAPGQPFETLIGSRFPDMLPVETMRRLRGKMQLLARDGTSARIFGLDLMGDGRRFDVAVHQSERCYIFEFEPKLGEPGDRDDLSLVQPLIARVRRQSDLAAMAEEAARGLRALTGFERVMVYQFAADASGKVIAEVAAPGKGGYLDLRFPASDIPAQARRLYTRSLLRLIADATDPGVPVLPALNPEGQPLDLSLSVTRAVSPIHLEYLRNMGVQGSMSVSIVKDGELWGLFACHHSTPHYIDFELRTAVELFAQLFTYELAQAEDAAAREAAARAQGLHDRLMARISSGESLAESFGGLGQEIGQVIAHDGLVLYTEGEFWAQGATPTEEEFMGLARFLNTAAISRVFATDHLAARYPAAADFAERASGLLALPVSRSPRDYIVLFRREVARSVNWAGNPEKPAEPGPNGWRLSPRKSFEAWQQVVRNHSAPWQASERAAAEALRVTLLEVVLKLTDAANSERRRAQEQQELLIAELNHRVRNILNLIRGLVSQSRQGASSLPDFVTSLDGRVQALARAHDQLTRKDWAPSSLRELLDVEIRGFLAGEAQRVLVEGPDMLVAPEAFSTLALVLHELVTNSAKYGALSVAEGRVTVTFTAAPDGMLAIDWVERNGPAVRAPTRRGFGTTIIEKSIPFELKGTARLSFRFSGLEAHFQLPARYVLGPAVVEPAALAAGVPAPAAGGTGLSGEVLVVEDTMIIAMDAADILGDLGADNVQVASSNAEALRMVGVTRFRLALLDVNLGTETSRPVAEALAAQGVPLILATGYGDSEEVQQAYPPALMLKKPYTTEMLAALVAQVMAAQS